MRREGRKNTVLLELILVILFFSLSAVVTLQLFVTAHQQSRLSEEKVMALTVAQSAAEAYRQSPMELERVFPREDGWRFEKGNVAAYVKEYGSDWTAAEDNGAYELRVTIRSAAAPGDLGEIHMEVKSLKTPQAVLCALDVKRAVLSGQEAGA